MDWDDISQPIYDRGFNWMVILCVSYDCLKIRTTLLVSFTLGRDVVCDGPGWVSGLTRGDAAFAMCHGSTAKIITYSWDVEIVERCQRA